MIVSRTPFRISFMGGRTDFPNFYEQDEGAVVASSINKFVYVSVSSRFDRCYELNFKEKEEVSRIEDIKHPIARAALEAYGPARGGAVVGSNSEIPSGTGLGSSSSFTVGLLNALQANLGIPYKPRKLAEEACRLEIEKLGAYTGKQDQYCAAFGGLSYIRFCPNGKVLVDPISMNSKNRLEFEEHIQVFYTGVRREGAEILKEEKGKMSRESLMYMRNLAREFKNELEGICSFQRLGKILDDGWQVKRDINSKISNGKIDEYYANAMEAGAYGGKLLGAGGGGYLLFLSPPENRQRLRSVLSDLTPLELSFESQGSQIILWK